MLRSIAGEPREPSPPIGLRAVVGVERKQIPIGCRGWINLHMHRRGRRLHIPGEPGWEYLAFIIFFPHGPYVDDLGWTLDSTITKPSQKIGTLAECWMLVNAVSGTLNWNARTGLLLSSLLLSSSPFMSVIFNIAMSCQELLSVVALLTDSRRRFSDMIFLYTYLFF